MPERAGFLKRLFGLQAKPHAFAAPTPDAHVTPDPARCVQCGVCGYNCPVGIPVRDYARQGKVVEDPRCVQCGQCIEVCPRGTLRWHSRSAEHFRLEADADYARLMSLFPPDGPEAPA
jgi:ferredoxin